MQTCNISIACLRSKHDSLYLLQNGVSLDAFANKERSDTVVLVKNIPFNTTEDELKELYNILALGAMKFYLLRVDPKKTMVFNPQESIEFHGFTGPFVQYTHARIKSILRKEPLTDNQEPIDSNDLLKLEKEVIVILEQYPDAIEQACAEHNPSVIAMFVFNLAKTFNSFYTEHSIANAETATKKQLRLQLAIMTANTLKSGMELLGIRVPERM